MKATDINPCFPPDALAGRNVIDVFFSQNSHLGRFGRITRESVPPKNRKITGELQTNNLKQCLSTRGPW